MDYTRRSGLWSFLLLSYRSDYLPEISSSSEHWRHRTTGGWQPQLALSPQSTAQPTRTTTHARAQSIPSALSSGTAQPSIHRLRSRLHAPRAAGIGSANSLVAESAAAIRRSEARSELLECLRTLPIPTDLERLRTLPIPPEPELESDWDALVAGRTRRSAQDYDVDMDSDEDEVPPPRRPVELLSLRPSVSRSSLRFRSRNDPSPARQIPPLRVPSGSSRPRPSVTFDDEPEEQQPTASSSGLNSRRPLSIHPRRPIVRLRQHPISGEISPPAPASATASVDRRHASWEAPSRDAAVSSTYEYLSALSHGFDSQYSSISDMAHTIASNTTNAPPSPAWGEIESPFSTLFARSPGPSPSVTRGSSSPRRPELDRQSSFPSLPPPDLGGDFDRSEDMLRAADTDGAPATPTSESPTNSYYPARPPTPPSSNDNPYTGVFRLTFQRRNEAADRAAAQRRVPEPPSIPPLYFGREFETNTPATATMSQEGSGSETRVSFCLV
ncbi:hypothetical protein C8R47DRAFT_468287 [Mycena vitilis]|nr:hypothetical protein C8R47DRAFT_468287 [Mycena vitilis]